MLGTNKIHWGDCLEIMQDISDNSIDMILCDLPYQTTACSWDVKIPLKPLWSHYKRVIKSTGIIALTATQPFVTELIQSNPEWFKYCWYWLKNTCTGFQHAKNQPLRRIEEVLIFSPAPMGHESLLGEKRMTYNPQGLVRSKLNYGKAGKRKFGSTVGSRPSHTDIFKSEFENYPDHILDFESVVNRQHPTEKPVALFEYLIRIYTDSGDLVLDNCAGSGTTAIAALNTGRKYILIEKERKFCNIANTRVRNRQLPLHIETNDTEEKCRSCLSNCELQLGLCSTCNEIWEQSGDS